MCLFWFYIKTSPIKTIISYFFPNHESKSCKNKCKKHLSHQWPSPKYCTPCSEVSSQNSFATFPTGHWSSSPSSLGFFLSGCFVTQTCRLATGPSTSTQPLKGSHNLPGALTMPRPSRVWWCKLCCGCGWLFGNATWFKSWRVNLRPRTRCAEIGSRWDGRNHCCAAAVGQYGSSGSCGMPALTGWSGISKGTLEPHSDKSISPLNGTVQEWRVGKISQISFVSHN